MIALACAKGGSGKTTTTLGLAEAFARAGRQSLAIDGDQQLPDLHVTAGVDRRPTVADLGSGTDWRSIAQTIPGTTDANVIPGPESDRSTDLGRALERIDDRSTKVLVDCPSGAGPDTIEPLSAAEEVVVVTTGTDRSLSAARTTIDIARRVDVPVAGAILTHCESVPSEFEESFDVPVLGVVPESERPLEDEQVTSVYDDVVLELMADDPIDTPSPATRNDPVTDGVETGIEAIDDEIGGVTGGSVLALTAEPGSQSELFLYRLTATRGTLYLSTSRSETAVRNAIECTGVETGSPTVRYLADDDPVAEARELIRQLPAGSNVVVDTADVLERADRSAYVGFLNDLKEHIVDTDSLAFLHCLDSPAPPENRVTTEHHADAVLEFRTGGDGMTIENQLTLSKLRSDDLEDGKSDEPERELIEAHHENGDPHLS